MVVYHDQMVLMMDLDLTDLTMLQDKITLQASDLMSRELEGITLEVVLELQDPMLKLQDRIMELQGPTMLLQDPIMELQDPIMDLQGPIMESQDQILEPLGLIMKCQDLILAFLDLILVSPDPTIDLDRTIHQDQIQA